MDREGKSYLILILKILMVRPLAGKYKIGDYLQESFSGHSFFQHPEVFTPVVDKRLVQMAMRIYG